jgi:hypothetical protein
VTTFQKAKPPAGTEGFYQQPTEKEMAMSSEILNESDDALNGSSGISDEQISWGDHFVSSGIRCYLTPKMRVEVVMRDQVIRMSTEEARALSKILLDAVSQENQVLSASGGMTVPAPQTSEDAVADDFFEESMTIIRKVQETGTGWQKLFFNAKLLSHANESQERLNSGLYDPYRKPL